MDPILLAAAALFVASLVLWLLTHVEARRARRAAQAARDAVAEVAAADTALESAVGVTPAEQHRLTGLRGER